MKSTGLDYLLSTLVIGLLLVLSVTLVALVVPFTIRLAGDYHVLLDLALGLVAYGLLTAMLVRAMLRWRPIAPGSYDFDSTTFTYWKLLTVTYRLGQGALRPFTPVFLLPVVDALYGARIGRDVAFGGVIDDPYMVSVGDGTALGTASMVCGSFVQGQSITCGPVRIGRDVTIGPNCVVFPDTEIGDGATVMVASYVMPGTRIPAGEVWRGNPARKWVQPKAAAPAAASD